MGVRTRPGSSCRVTGSEQLRRRWLQIASRSYTCTVSGGLNGHKANCRLPSNLRMRRVFRCLHCRYCRTLERLPRAISETEPDGAVTHNRVEGSCLAGRCGDGVRKQVVRDGADQVRRRMEQNPVALRRLTAGPLHRAAVEPERAVALWRCVLSCASISGIWHSACSAWHPAEIKDPVVVTS